MAFRFSLATLLRMREIAEQREERLLGQILNQIVLARQTLLDLEAQRRGVIARRELAIQERTSSAEITNFYERMYAIEELEKSGRENLAKLEILRAQQMKVYETAHRNHELLSGMRADQREAWQREQVRQEQNMMDDNFSSRRSFR